MRCYPCSNQSSPHTHALVTLAGTAVTGERGSREWALLKKGNYDKSSVRGLMYGAFSDALCAVIHCLVLARSGAVNLVTVCWFVAAEGAEPGFAAEWRLRVSKAHLQNLLAGGGDSISKIVGQPRTNADLVHTHFVDMGQSRLRIILGLARRF